MQFQTFQIRVGDSEAMDEMNAFLRKYRVISVAHNFAIISECGYWFFCVEYIPQGKPVLDFKNRSDRIDYKEVLTDEQFEVFSQLRDWRKNIAQQEGVPIYTICTNEQLSYMVQNRCNNREALTKAPGFSAAKNQKYGESLLKILNSFFDGINNDEKSGTVNGTNNP